MRIKMPPAAGSAGSNSSSSEQDAAGPQALKSPNGRSAQGVQSCSSMHRPLGARGVKSGHVPAPALPAEHSRSSTGTRQASSGGAVKAGPLGMAAGVMPHREKRAAAVSLRPAASKSPPAAAAKGPTTGNARRLLGRTAGTATTGPVQQPQGGVQQHVAACTQAQQQQRGQEVPGSRWGGKPAVQPHMQQEVLAADLAARQALSEAGAASHGSDLGQTQGTSAGDALEVAPRQRSQDTMGSSLSLSAGPEAMVGLTQQQLHRVLQRPWLQEAQEPAGSTAQSAVGRRSSSHSSTAEASGSQAVSKHSPGDANSLNAVIESASSSVNNRAFVSQLHPQALPPDAASSSSSAAASAAAAAAGDTGGTAAAQAQQKGCRTFAGSSNGGSWPGLKAFGAAAAAGGPAGPAAGATGGSQGGLSTLQHAAKGSPLKPRTNGIRLRGRSRAQPQHLSLSLESAALLPLQGSAGNERSSHGSSVADAALLDGPNAWANTSLEMVQEEQQHRQQQQQQGETQLGPTSSNGSLHGGSSSGGSQGVGQDALSRDNSRQYSSGAAGVAAEHSENQQPRQRRRWSGPSPVPQPSEAHQPDTAGQLQQQGWEHAHIPAGEHQPQQQQGSHTHIQQQRQPQQQEQHIPPATTCPMPAAAEQHALSRKHLQALAASCSMHSSGELSANTSDLACMSIASAATGCTTLSGLAGVYLQHPSKPTKACPRPSFVPKLQLTGIEAEGHATPAGQVLPEPHHHSQQQGQQQQGNAKQPTPRGYQQSTQQQAVTPAPGKANGAPAVSSTPGNQQQQQQLTPCSSTGHHLGSARSYLTAEELADIAPLMAHPSARRHSAGTAAPEAEAASPAGLAAAVDAAGHEASGGAARGPALTAGPRATPRASESVSSVSAGSGREAAAAAAATSSRRAEGAAGQPPPAPGPASSVPSSARGNHQTMQRAGAAGVAGEHSGPAQRTSLGGGASVQAYRPSSGGGSGGALGNGVGYWGSNGGSCPASENPTPRLSDGTVAAGRAAGMRSRPSTSGGGAASSTQHAEQRAGAAAGSGSIAVGQHGSSTATAAGAPAGAGSSVEPEAAAAGAHPGHGIVLAPVPQPCAASATAAAASSFMTMRPAHLYRSVSTGERCCTLPVSHIWLDPGHSWCYPCGLLINHPSANRILVHS